MNSQLPASVSRARIQLMLKHTYLASATAHLKFYSVNEHWCQTMATDGFNVFINDQFVEALSEDEIIGVIAHEIMHCVLGHIDRRKDRRPDVWNIAIDYATNLLLIDSGIKLPKTGLLDRKYRGMTAEDIYKSILSLSEYDLSKILSAAVGCSDQEEGSDDKNNDLETGQDRGFSDIHLDVNDPRGIWARSSDFPTESDRQRLRKSWQEELSSKLPGHISGTFSEEISKAGEQQIDWREYFSRFMSGLRRDDYRLFPPNKKHLWRQIYLPSFGSPGPDHIVVIIDTSGSMNKDLLGQLLTEIDAARQICECKLTIMQCDADIKHVDQYESWDLMNQSFDSLKFHGRGGTSFVPPFEWITKYVEAGHPYPDAAIYMTDGFGAFPEKIPEYPCLWIVPKSGSKQFPFGLVFRINS